MFTIFNLSFLFCYKPVLSTLKRRSGHDEEKRGQESSHCELVLSPSSWFYCFRKLQCCFKLANNGVKIEI